jgi:hypothetical protein
VAGTTTTKPPAKRLYKKFANEGVIELQPVKDILHIILIVCSLLEKPVKGLFFLESYEILG